MCLFKYENRIEDVIYLQSYLPSACLQLGTVTLLTASLSVLLPAGPQ